MSLNRSVRFGPSLAEVHRPASMGRIMHLGYMTPLEPVITTPEGVGLGVGGALLVTGAVVKNKKTGLILMILGGAGALYGVGSAIYRAIAKPAGVPVAVKPAGFPGASLVTALAPTAVPLIQKLFASQPTPATTNTPGSSPWGPGGPPVTSLPGGSAPAPSSSVVTTVPVVAPADSGSSDGGMVTSLDDGVAGLRGW